MKSHDRDRETHFAVIDKFIDLADLPSDEAAMLKVELQRYMRVRLDRGHWIEPEITRFHTSWYREFYRLVGQRDPYIKAKNVSNDVARSILDRIDVGTLRRAVLASIVANNLDYGVYRFDEGTLPITATDFADLDGLELGFDHYDELESGLERASSLLYLPDNNGEVEFDRHVLERITERWPDLEVTIAGKHEPMLNDVTVDELRDLGFEGFGRVMSTGSNCFGLPPDEISDEMHRAVGESDLIIAKGQAYLEFFTEYAIDRVVHLAHAKIDVVDPQLPLIEAGCDIILHSRHYAADKPAYPVFG